MSTRNYKNRNDSFSGSTGNEGANIPDDLELPSCTLEDVDRALFNLFDKQIPLHTLKFVATNQSLYV